MIVQLCQLACASQPTIIGPMSMPIGIRATTGKVRAGTCSGRPLTSKCPIFLYCVGSLFGSPPGSICELHVWLKVELSLADKRSVVCIADARRARWWL